MLKRNILECPSFCQFEHGTCTRIKGKLELQDAFFAYPSKPLNISTQINEAIAKIEDQDVCNVQDWQSLLVDGKIIYCEICKAIRRSHLLVADITTLNDNVLFEIGFAIGLGKKLWLLRDSSFERDHKQISQFGLLDYTGYTDYRNSDEIMTKFMMQKPWEQKDPNNFYFESEITDNSKLVYLKSNHNNDGSINLTSLIKKSRLPCDTIDPRENPQFSLRDYSKRLASCLGLVVHMADPSRKDALLHNALCTFLAGMGLAMEKPVLILQEGEIERPIDYGEILRTYTNAKNIRIYVDQWLPHVEKNFESGKSVTSPIKNATPLESISLGDVAAENEIDNLPNYFVRTPIFQSVLQAKDCIVAGRKGTGKTAIFYETRRQFWKQWKYVVLDLKPEGYQLKLFSEVILKNFPESTKHYLIKSFWEYVLLSELGRMILKDTNFAFQRPETTKFYREIEKNINPLGINWENDFAQRLLDLVNQLQLKLSSFSRDASPAEVTQHLYQNQLGPLRNAVMNYSSLKEGVVILVDNLDKDWKPFEDISIEIVILRSLLDSLKSLSNDFSKHKATFKSVVFIRSDILKLLNAKTPDKGKDTVISLQWQDKESLKLVIKQRLEAGGLTFDKDWNSIFTNSCRGIDSFSYLVDRTMMRPRDLLNFCKLSIDTAIGRGHTSVQEEDIIFAEQKFSATMLGNLAEEVRDVYGDLQNYLLEFLGEPLPISEDRINELINSAAGSGQAEAKQAKEISDLLFEYGFFGIETGSGQFSYAGISHLQPEVVKKMAEKYARRTGEPINYTVHPTFRTALGMDETVG